MIMKLNTERSLIVAVLIAANAASGSLSPAMTPVPDKVACAVADRQAFTEPDQVHLTGWIGDRIEVNENNRLAAFDEEGRNPRDIFLARDDRVPTLRVVL